MRRLLSIISLLTLVGVLYGVARTGPFAMNQHRSLMTVPSENITFTKEHASAFARLALKGIDREYPNHPGHVLNDAADVKDPRALHPAFYGCYDWHSSVHGHWMLVRLLRRFPGLPEAKQIRGVLAAHLTAENIRSRGRLFHAAESPLLRTHLRLGLAAQAGRGA